MDSGLHQNDIHINATTRGMRRSNLLSLITSIIPVIRYFGLL